MTILLVILCLVLFVLLITCLKLNPFLAFLITSITAGILLGMPIDKIPASIENEISRILNKTIEIFLQKKILQHFRA